MPPQQESNDGTATTNTVSVSGGIGEYIDSNDGSGLDTNPQDCISEGDDNNNGSSERRRRSSAVGGRSLRPGELERLGSQRIPIRQSQVRRVLRDERRKSFIVEFSEMKGPPQIAILMALLALGLGSTIGIVPAIMGDRFARLQHGYNGTQSCDSFGSSTSLDNSNNTMKPIECTLGSNDAQAAASVTNLISNIFTFVSASLMGSVSDEYGRKGPLLIGLVMAMAPSFCLYLMNYVPYMSPWWYYCTGAVSGLVPWMAIALSALNDVLPKEFRAPGIGLLFAGFLLGISIAPTFSLLLQRTTLCLISFLVVLIGFVMTVVCVPETLSASVAEETKRRRLEKQRRLGDREEEIRIRLQHQLYGDNSDSDSSGSSSFPSYLWLGMKQFYYGSSCGCRLIKSGIRLLLIRPIEEMLILNRNTFFRILTGLAFFTGMVQSGDQVLLLYYLEDHLDFNQSDVSLMFLIIGVAGIIVQVFVMKPLNDMVGEKMVIAISFLTGSCVNFLYGIAQHKATIFAALVLSAFGGMSFPTISAIKANNVDPTEQGRIQGALYSVKALAAGVGPAVLQFVYSRTNNDNDSNDNNSSWWYGPGTMWYFASFLFLVAVGLAITLPNDKANTSPRHGGGGGSSSNHDDNNNNIRENELEEYRALVSDDDDDDDDNENDGEEEGSSSSSEYGTV